MISTFLRTSGTNVPAEMPNLFNNPLEMIFGMGEI